MVDFLTPAGESRAAVALHDALAGGAAHRDAQVAVRVLAEHALAAERLVAGDDVVAWRHMTDRKVNNRTETYDSM